MPDKKTVILSAAILLASLSVFLWLVDRGKERPKRHEMEIFYLSHSPAEAIVQKVEMIAANYPVSIRKYDFEDRQNRVLIEQRGLLEHMPVAIFIDGSGEFEIAGRRIVFRNFPQGDAFVPTYEGEWSYEDLEKVLAAKAGAK